MSPVKHSDKRARRENLPTHDPFKRQDAHQHEEEEEEEDEEELPFDGQVAENEDAEWVDGDDDGRDYRWRFGDEIDPLALAEDDASGAQPYQQFERLEYEALAARKRKFLSQEAKDSDKSDRKGKHPELFGASIDEIWEASGLGASRSRKKKKKRGRKPAQLSPELKKKLGDANLLYATSRYEEALDLLKEVVRLAPNMADPYHTLGLVYNSMGNRKKAISFYMLAAHLTPKDVSLWKRLASMSVEDGSTTQAVYCLRKAMKADPEDVHVKWELGALFVELKDFAKAAETYEGILLAHPSDVEVCKMVAKMHHQGGRIEDAKQVLKKLIDEHPTEANLTVVNLLADLHMDNKDFSAAITCIEHARKVYCSGQGLPLDLAVKAGICHAHLGLDSIAERYCEALGKEQAEEFSDLVLQVGDAYMGLGHHKSALKYYGMLDGISSLQNSSLWTKMAQCHVAMNEHAAAVALYQKVVAGATHDVDVRITLAGLLLEINKLEEASNVLVPPHSTECSEEKQPWWLDGRVILMLAKVYYLASRFDSFLEVMVPCLRNALDVEIHNQKVKGKRRLPKRVLLARAKLLDNGGGFNDPFIRFNPVMSGSEKLKASRAKKALAKLEAKKEEKRAAVLAAGLEWQSEDESEPEVMDVELRVQPIPKLFDDEEHCQLIVQACKLLGTRKRYGEALEIINQTLKIAHPNVINKRPELRSLGAEITFKAKDAKHGYECVRYIVQQQPYSLSAWNCYYQAVSSSETRIPRHTKFILNMRTKYPDCVPPMIICGHQFAMISQPQGALREYLQAYKLQPEDPFVNLCIGVSLINLSLGFRLTNRNQCVMQGFAFLHKYQQLSENSQESSYNLARAYHHVGFVTLAVKYYEKVLSHFEKDLHMPQDFLVLQDDILQNVDMTAEKSSKGTCDLRKEAAYNLHLIYKQSGAHGLARQMLKDYCTP